MPKGIVLIHIQDFGNTYRASGSLVCLQGRIGEEPLKLVFKKIRYIVSIFLTADTALTAVSGDELASSGEFVDGETAAVGTALTFRHAGIVFQFTEFLIR